MKLRKLTALFGPAVALIALSIPASAAFILNGDFAINFTGAISYSPPDPSFLQSANAITIPITSGGVGEHIANIPPTYLTLPNDFAAGGHTPLTVGGGVFFGGAAGYTLFLTGGALPVVSFASTTPADTLTFTASGIVVTRGPVGGANTVAIFYSGTVSDSAGIYNPNEAASLSFAFDQTGGASGVVSFSGTFAAPPAAAPPGGVPEPATMSLFGSALVGLGLLGRKRLAH